jgi:serine protease SohB
MAPTHPQVILRLKSPGGSVTGYGLASAELERLSKARVKLTVCVDEVSVRACARACARACVRALV